MSILARRLLASFVALSLHLGAAASAQPTLEAVADFSTYPLPLGPPYDGVTLGPDGALYGITSGEGLNGSLYRVMPGGGLEALALLQSTLGAAPTGPLVYTGDAIFGTTRQGGTGERGTVFVWSSATGLRTVHDFGLSRDPVSGFFLGGNIPSALSLGPDGHLYGTTFVGGVGGGGTIFRITVDGVFTVVRHFVDSTIVADPDARGLDGWSPTATLNAGVDGRMYGTTDGGGEHRWGTVFSIGVDGSFVKHADLSQAQARPGAVVQGSDGTLYFVARQGGTGGGAVWALSLSTGLLSNVYSAPASCGLPGLQSDGLTRTANGDVLGVVNSTCGGLLFRLNGGALTPLYEDPQGSLALHGRTLEGADGWLLGTATSGFTGRGMVYRFFETQRAPAGLELTLSANARSIGQEVTITVSLGDDAGSAVASHPVRVTVEGANPRLLDALTGTSGVATVQYAGTTVGVDRIVASTSYGGKALTTVPAEVTWLSPPPPPPPVIIETPPILPLQELYGAQLWLGFVRVMSEQAATPSFEDLCYLDTLQPAALRIADRKFVTMQLKKLANGIATASTFVYSFPGYSVGKYLASVGLDVLAAGTGYSDKPLSVEASKSVVKNLSGYLVSRAVSEQAGKDLGTVFDVYDVIDLLSLDKVQTDRVQGKYGKARVNLSLWYNPWSHYVTATLRGSCSSSSYVLLYKVDEIGLPLNAGTVQSFLGRF